MNGEFVNNPPNEVIELDNFSLLRFPPFSGFMGGGRGDKKTRSLSI